MFACLEAASLDERIPNKNTSASTNYSYEYKIMRKTWVQTGVGNLYWILTLQEPHFLNLSNGGDMCILCYETITYETMRDT